MKLYLTIDYQTFSIHLPITICFQNATANKSLNKSDKSGISSIERYTTETFQKVAFERLKSEVKVESSIQNEALGHFAPSDIFRLESIRKF